MTEALEQAGTAGPAIAAAPDAISAGAILRQAREAAGLHVAAMAVSLKVPVSKLEALEQDRYELLPDAVFARGLASSLCRTLKIDPRPVLERLPRTATPRLIQNNDGINAPFRSPRDAIAPSWREQLTRPVSLIVGALLLGALVVVLLPRTHLDERAATADGKDALSGPVAAPVVAEAANPAITASAMSPAPPASQLVAASIRVPQTTDQGAAVPQAAPRAIAAPAAVVSPHEPAASAASAAAPATGAGVVVFRAKAPSWIEVRDAKGAVPIRKVLAAGESANVSGVMPLQVVIGNVQATEVDVRGKRFDLQPLTRDNVARFHIK